VVGNLELVDFFITLELAPQSFGVAGPLAKLAAELADVVRVGAEMAVNEAIGVLGDHLGELDRDERIAEMTEKFKSL